MVLFLPNTLACLTTPSFTEPGLTIRPAQMGRIQEHSQLRFDHDSARVSTTVSFHVLTILIIPLFEKYRWHGWMHHVYDETPNDPVAVPDYLPTSTISHAIYNTHVGRVDPAAAANEREQIDTSQYR